MASIALGIFYVLGFAGIYVALRILWGLTRSTMRDGVVVK